MENKKDVKKTINKKAVIIAGACAVVAVGGAVRAYLGDGFDYYGLKMKGCGKKKYKLLLETNSKSVIENFSIFIDSMRKRKGAMCGLKFTSGADMKEGFEEVLAKYEDSDFDICDILVNMHN